MKKYLFLSILYLFFSCHNESDSPIMQTPQNNCDQDIVVNNVDYNNTTSSSRINALSIGSNCLLINFAESGCDGNSWTYNLVTDGVIDTSTSPVIRRLKFRVNNSEACLAVFTKQRSFDLNSLRVNGQQSVKLVIEYQYQQTKEIVYSY